MASGPGYVIEKLSAVHDLGSFECGNSALNVWLKRFARTNMQNDSVRVYVAHQGDNLVVGYHALTAGSIERADAPKRVSHGLAAHPIGVIVLARLAVDVTWQGKGLGATLLQDAVTRSEQAADTVGVRAVLVHAINETARSFYLRFGFSPTVVDDLRLILLMKDLRALLKSKRR
jgi:GNAT superfamily N-acetyltransferase